jgi:RimK family alpha-L-glutamate ligase
VLLHRVAIFTEDPGWHGARIRQSLAQRGCEGLYVSLTACRFALGDEPLPLVVPGFEDRLPEAVFVRGVPGGSLEEVTFFLDVLHALKLLGITVYNDAGAIERTVDKAMTSFRLHCGGIPTPPTWTVRDRLQAEAIARTEIAAGHEIVSKPLFGSQGEGLRRYAAADEIGELSDSNGIFYLQRFVDSASDAPHDWRVFVIRNKAVAAMRRCGVTWLNNIAQGARCEPARLDDLLLCRLAEDAVRLLDMDYAGVDIIRDRHGRYSVLEVNSIPAWKGLQTVSDVDIAGLLVYDLLSLCPPLAGREATAV